MVRRSPRNWTTEEMAQSVVRLYNKAVNEGMNMSDLGKILDCQPSQVREIVETAHSILGLDAPSFPTLNAANGGMSRIRQSGQKSLTTTIPHQHLQRLGLEVGDWIVYVYNPYDNSLVIEPYDQAKKKIYDNPFDLR